MYLLGGYVVVQNAFNRTIEELKCIWQASPIGAAYLLIEP